MKPEFNKKYTTVSVYAFLVIAASLCFWAILNHIGVVLGVLKKIGQVLIPFVNGFIIAYLINPVVKTAEKWFSRVGQENLSPD